MFITDFTFKRAIVYLSAMMIAASMIGCGKTESSDDKSAEDTAAVTVTAESLTAESPAETSAVTEEEPPVSETDAETTPAVTSAPLDGNGKIESMMSSIEAEIPEITAWSGLDNASAPEVTDDETTVETTAEGSTKTAPSDASEIKSEQQLVFDGVFYDNTTFTSEGIDMPEGWTINTEESSNLAYIKDAYKNCSVTLGNSKGAAFMIVGSESDSADALPPLTLYKGLTWGATADDIIAAYGEPAKTSSNEQYGTTLTNLRYSAPDGGTIIYQISSDRGLVIVNCCGN